MPHRLVLVALTGAIVAAGCSSGKDMEIVEGTGIYEHLIGNGTDTTLANDDRTIYFSVMEGMVAIAAK